MASQSKMNKGTERLIACADIKHHIFPVPLFLIREELMNSARYGAKNVWIRFQENADGTIRMTVRDDGSGRADADRLKSPAETNGGGTSRYAAGLPIAQLKRGNQDDTWSAAWKRTGEEMAMFMTNDRVETKVCVPFPKYHPWTKTSESGFIHETTLRPEKIPGVKLSDLLPLLREIICGSMRPQTLKCMCIDIAVIDNTGKVVAASTSTDKSDPWHTFEEVITGSSSRVITKILRFGDVVMTAKFVIAGKALFTDNVKKLTKGGQNRNTDIIPHFPNYGAISSPHSFFSQEGFVIADLPLDDALDLISHSLNYRYLFVDFSLDGKAAGPLTREDVEKLPTPASTKTGYLKSCPIYMGCMSVLKNGKPPSAEWLSWDATAQVHRAAVTPAPPPTVAKPTKVVTPVAKPPLPPAPLPPPPPPQVVAVPVIDPDVQWVRDNQLRLKKPLVIAELRKLGVL
jgi:hypothetical protein